MMKRLNPSILTAAFALVGVALGAGIAYAAHPAPVILKTYEELATQFGQQQLPVQVDPQSKKGFPYSPKQTCGTANCHDYDKIADHAFHSALGRNEWKDTIANGSTISHDGAFDSSKVKPWTQTTAMFGKW